MAKQLLKERFQELAGIKPLYENEASQVLIVTSEYGTEVEITDPEDIKAFLAGEEVNGEDSQGGTVEVSLDNAQDHRINEENFDNISFDDKVATFGAAGSDKRTGQVIGDILQLIKSTQIDPMEVMGEIGEEFKINFQFTGFDGKGKGGYTPPDDGLPKMDPDNWGFKNQ